MEEIENFYLKVIAKLKSLQSKRLNFEKQLPLKIELHEKWTNVFKARILLRRSEKLRNKINNGYYKAINECINQINKVYKEYLKCSDD